MTSPADISEQGGVSEPASEEALERGRLLFAGECKFVLGVAALAQLPDPDRAEIAFAGRSNVGKSSLLNALTSRTGLARTSKTPGRTQQLNFFALSHKLVGQLYIVDLPGYGYAKAPEELVKRWTKLVKAYLKGRPSLKRTYLLIDSRHGIKAVDSGIMDALDDSAVSYQVVLTKADKLKPAALEERFEATGAALKTHVAAHPQLIVTSAETGMGIGALRAAAASLASPA